jgi:hypothetical protein
MFFLNILGIDVKQQNSMWNEQKKIEANFMHIKFTQFNQ